MQYHEKEREKYTIVFVTVHNERVSSICMYICILFYCRCSEKNKMINRILFYFFIFFSFYLLPSWTYKFESCCLNEKANNTTTTRLLSCPLNFVIKIRSANFYTGNNCAPSACQKRFNKHYLPCNNHRTCSISIQCILMDSSTCPWLMKANSYSQHLVVEYDCLLHKPGVSLIDQTKKELQENIVLFSAKVNIESPLDLINDSTTLYDEEKEWREYFLKKYFPGKKFNEDKTMIIEQKRSLFSDIIRTVIILIIFALILIIFMVISLLIYKRIRLNQKKKLYGQQKHQPFPGDDAYDNLKATAMDTASDSGTTTDV